MKLLNLEILIFKENKHLYTQIQTEFERNIFLWLNDQLYNNHIVLFFVGGHNPDIIIIINEQESSLPTN